MGKKKRPPEKLTEDIIRESGCGQCDCCEQPLFKKGGYAGTGLCGPCCTGDASTIDEAGEGW
jgi:hypothetical protein